MTGDRLYSLAGTSVAALHLLRAADHDVTGAELDRTLLLWANTRALRDARAVNSSEWLFMDLRTAVNRRKDYENDPRLFPDWSAEDIDAEVLAELFLLVHGEPACAGRCCLNGSLLAGLDAIRPVGHQTASAAA